MTQPISLYFVTLVDTIDSSHVSIGLREDKPLPYLLNILEYMSSLRRNHDEINHSILLLTLIDPNASNILSLKTKEFPICTDWNSYIFEHQEIVGYKIKYNIKCNCFRIEWPPGLILNIHKMDYYKIIKSFNIYLNKSVCGKYGLLH